MCGWCDDAMVAVWQQLNYDWLVPWWCNWSHINNGWQCAHDDIMMVWSQLTNGIRIVGSCWCDGRITMLLLLLVVVMATRWCVCDDMMAVTVCCEHAFRLCLTCSAIGLITHAYYGGDNGGMVRCRPCVVGLGLWCAEFAMGWPW